MEIHLVADTNLFFECKKLEELPWYELKFDPVVILLTKPVLDEIDKHKKANGRTRERALEIFTRVRQLLEQNLEELEIRGASPRVLLRRAPLVKPDPGFAGDLDYDKADERLIGITSTLKAAASGYDVKLFTEDAGPATTAHGLAVPYLMINKSWRRPAAETDDQKKLKALQKQLEIYQEQEPKIIFDVCEPAGDNGVITLTETLATPLTSEEIDKFLDLLRAKHPEVTDFTAPEPSTKTDFFGTTTTEYGPPADSDITNYHDVLYPEWIVLCRRKLRSLHESRDVDQPPLVLNWHISNQGSRPASKVRIEFEAFGQLALRRCNHEDDAEEETDPSEHPLERLVPSFPSPPKPPAFSEKITRTPGPYEKEIGAFEDKIRDIVAPYAGILDPSSPTGKLAAFLSSAGIISSSGITGQSALHTNFPRPSPLSSRMLTLESALPTKRDPELFYYDDWPSAKSVKKGALTCELWRHQSDMEIFEFEVLFTGDGDVRGMVQCTVHAENLTKPEQAKVIVTRTIQQASLTGLADIMVNLCG